MFYETLHTQKAKKYPRSEAYVWINGIKVPWITLGKSDAEIASEQRKIRETQTPKPIKVTLRSGKGVNTFNYYIPNVFYSNLITFPHIKKVKSTLISQEIISVQPMTLPTGLLFYLNEIKK